MKKCIAFLILIMGFFSTAASASEIYSYTTQKIMTDGVSVKNIQRFYSDYSLNINLVTADLKNKYLAMELLKSGRGADKTDTTLNLSKSEEGIVAAVNGDFFSKYKGDQNFSLGIEIKDGKLLQSHINNDMAAGLVKDKILLHFIYYIIPQFDIRSIKIDDIKYKIYSINKAHKKSNFKFVQNP